MTLLRIKNIIDARGKTVKTLAESIDITPSELNGIIDGSIDARVDTLEKIADALDVPVASLFTDYVSERNSVTICPHCGGRYTLRVDIKKC